MARAESIKQQVLDHPTSEQLTESLWRELKKVLDRQVEAAEHGAPGGLERGLSALAAAALEDEALLAKIDDWIIGAVLRIVEQHRHEVGQLIAHTVSAWDPDETSRRIELQVGPGPAVHPDQRDAGGRDGRAAALHADAGGGARGAVGRRVGGSGRGVKSWAHASTPCRSDCSLKCSTDP